GIGWSVISRLGTKSMEVVTGIILARLLSPDAFGLIAMIMIFSGFANIFREMGFGAALIQKQDTTSEHHSSIFWLNLATGFFLTLLFIALSPVIANFYSEPLLIPVIILVSLNFLIGSVSVVQSSLLKKRLEFKRLALVELVTLLVSGAVGITLALLGFGVWSLAWQGVIATCSTVILIWVISDWRPAMSFKWTAIKDLLGFSMNLIGFSMLNYWARNADNLLIGRFIGTSALGIYSRAYSIMLLPLKMISRRVAQVMFPAFASIQANKKRVAKIYLRITHTIALVTFPMMIGLLTVSDHFVLAVFGNQWAGMIPILKVFCVVGMTQSIVTLNGNLYQSQGRADLQFKVGVVMGVLGVAAIVLGLRWGVKGVAYAYAIFTVLISYPDIKIAASLVGLSFLKVFTNLLGVSACAAVMGIAIWACGVLLPSNWPHWGYLLFQVPVGLIVYIMLIHSYKIKAYEDIRELVKEYWQSQRKPKAPQAKSAGAEATVQN
ncbi:MOP flippase family protein, partial [candidate division KSB1 bacterium]|nr:MOP flippase family protein [candidate division KSB1 bacterium]